MIYFNSNHPIEHKLAVLHLLLKRMQQRPLSTSYKQKGIDHNSTHCKSQWISLCISHKTQHTNITYILITTHKWHSSSQLQTWVTCTHYNPMICKLTKFFETTNSKSHSILTVPSVPFYTHDSITNTHSNSGIYQLTCHTCNVSYIGQTGT
jgi:hypothetical protein